MRVSWRPRKRSFRWNEVRCLNLFFFSTGRTCGEGDSGVVFPLHRVTLSIWPLLPAPSVLWDRDFNQRCYDSRTELADSS